MESDFFFASDDPQLLEAGRIAELFPAGDQILVRAAGSLADEDHLERLEALSAELASLSEVTGVQSATRGPRSPQLLPESPFWRRLLMPGGDSASLIVLSLTPQAGGETVRQVEAAVAGFASEGLHSQLSGVPFVVEQVRRSLVRDLRIFSSAAVALFGLVLALLFRSLPVVVGTLTSCAAAAAATLLVLALIGVPIGILTANLVTLVFVLTLSHTVFLTARWRSLGGDPATAAQQARRSVFTASFWCMATTLLGFASLTTASAKPLRELGVAGVIGALLAIAAAYLLFPPFLASARAASSAGRQGWLPRRPLAAGVTLGLCALLALGILRVQTDPDLLSYFQDGSPLHEGLAAIDRDGGSSPLSLVVGLPSGERLDTSEGIAQLAAAQQALEDDAATGAVLSAAALVAEAKETSPFAALLPPSSLLDLLSQDSYQRVALSFITADRDRAQFFLRMHEEERRENRRAVIDRLTRGISEQGLDVELVGGLYDLQDRLGSLVRSSLLRGLLLLWLLFAGIAFAVSRNGRSTAALVFCLPWVPLAVVGTFGLLGRPLDIISSTAPTIALALGVDSMIHLAAAARRARHAGRAPAAAWRQALQETATAVVSATAIVAIGFSIFFASSFPPTQRFGGAVVVGSLLAAALALTVLPRLAGGRERA
ncbi:MAG: MMPL family transporter [Acidobacteriota bacterium]